MSGPHSIWTKLGKGYSLSLLFAPNLRRLLLYSECTPYVWSISQLRRGKTLAFCTTHQPFPYVVHASVVCTTPITIGRP